MKRPDLEIGPPASSIATAGRMNAAGIAVFYGATEPDVALAEVRPPVGSKVLIGCFEIIRPLKLLDLIAMKDISNPEGSLFDEEYRYHLKQIEFLRGLGERLSKPVMPGDEVFDYLPTQEIADFLATEVRPTLDGIIYPSVQIGSATPAHRPLAWSGIGPKRCNVVLFQKSAHVQPLDEKGKPSVSDDCLFGSLFPESPNHFDSGPDLKYSVWVENNNKVDATDESIDNSCLKFVSLDVHYVDAVKIETRHSEVFRFPRYPKPDE